MRPATSRPRARSASTRRRHRRRAAAALLRLLAEVHLDQHPRARARGGRSRRRARPGRPTASTRPTARAPAPCCAGAARGSATTRAAARSSAGALASSSWARFSPEVDDPGVDDLRRPARPVTVLVAATSVTVGRVAPGARGGAGDARPDLGDRAPRPTSTVAHCVAHHDHGLATGGAVAPVREVVGRRRGAHVDVVERRRPRPRRARRAPRPGRRARARPSSVRPATSGPKRGRRAGRGGRRRTRSARGGCTGRAPRRTGSPPTRAQRRDRGARSRPARARTIRRGRPPTAPGATSAIGAQSATSTTSGSPIRGGDRGVGRRAARTAARVDGDDVGAVHLAQPHPLARVGGHAVERARRAPRRFSATAAGSSPTWSPRLRVAYGGRETPPWRSVNQTRASAARGSRVDVGDRTARSAQELGDVELVVARRRRRRRRRRARSRCRRRGRRHRRRARAT